MARKRSLGFSPAEFREKFRAGMTVRNYQVVFLAKAVSEGNLCGFAQRDQLGSPISLDCKREARFARSSEIRNLRRCLSNICSPGLFESRKTW